MLLPASIEIALSRTLPGRLPALNQPEPKFLVIGIAGGSRETAALFGPRRNRSVILGSWMTPAALQ